MKLNKEKLRLFIKFVKYIYPYRKKQAVALILCVFSMALSLVSPYLSKLLVDKAIITKNLKSFIIIGLIGAGIFLLSGIIEAAVGLLKKAIRLKLNFDLNKKLFWHLQALPFELFQNKSTGGNIYNINYDIERAVDLIISVPEEIVRTFPKAFFILMIVFFLDWQMALVSIILAPLLYLPLYWFTGRMRKVWEESYRSSQGIFEMLGEVFTHMYLVKAFGKEKKETMTYIKKLINNIRLQVKNIRLETINNLVGSGISRAIMGITALFGGWQVIRGRISIGTFTAIILYLNQLFGLQYRIAFSIQNFVIGLISCQRIDDILQEDRGMKRIPEVKKELSFDNPKIEFDRVSFGYRQGAYVIKGIDFCIEKGFFALVGPSGCGKTTVLNLILGLYNFWEGDIRINENSIRGIHPKSLRGQISIASQEPLLWNDSIANNIKYAREDAGQEEIIEVARLSGVDDFARQLPNGYETIIGENACKLSEGQKQKIAISRALIQRPKVLILDEAMASMDSVSEERIIKMIKELPIHTVIIVSHRLSTVLACDQACLLKSPGEAVIGRPGDLLGGDKAFSNLFSAQV